MRGFVLVALLAAVGCAYAEEIEYYSDKYDDINIREILENDRLRSQYYNCVMDTGPCVTPDAIHFKTNLPEALTTQCKRCTEKQKQALELVTEWYTEHRPAEWEALLKKLLENAKKANAQS